MALKIANMLNELFVNECEEQNLRQILHGERFDLPLARYQAGVCNVCFLNTSRGHGNYHFFLCNFANICYNFIVCCSQCCSALSAADK